MDEPFLDENSELIGDESDKSLIVRDIMRLLIIFLSIFLVVTIALNYVTANYYYPVNVSGTSMWPTLNDGDVLIADRNATVKRLDIVVVDMPATEEHPAELLIKRVIAVGGETIWTVEGAVYIRHADGTVDERIEEPYLHERNRNNTWHVTEKYYMYPDVKHTEVPEGYVYVMGDNRQNSSDSRTYGCFALDELAGVIVPYWMEHKDILTKILG